MFVNKLPLRLKGKRKQLGKIAGNFCLQMPPVAIKYIVSFSSQDDKHPVSNLVKGDGFRKWLSHPQEKSGQMEAIFQLEQCTVISYIDIGSIWCASLEIKVGRSDWPAGREFETLAYTVNLMSPADCLTNKNPNKTQMFSPDLFCQETAKKEWDRIKVICRQPYKKLVQFGLSFIRVKTSVSTGVSTEKLDKNSATPASASVKDIRKHFMEKLDPRSSKGNDQLKSRLLKIAASSDNGIQHDDSLTRTAKLVLAASGTKPKAYAVNSPVPNAEKSGMYSSRVEQTFGPKFDEEVDEFLKQLVIDPKELDSITMADVRHKFERKKKRKLTKDEKKIFIQKATNHLTSAFKDRTNHKVEKENINTETKLPIVNNKEANKNTVKSANKIELPQKNEAVLDKNKNCAKRKLDSSNDIATPPRKKAVRENCSPVTLIQKMKSNTVEKKDLIGQLKKAKQSGPMADCVASPGTPFSYKGLRGREPDYESQLNEQGSVTKSTSVSQNNSINANNSTVEANTDETLNSPIASNLMPNKKESFILDISSDEEWLTKTDIEVPKSKRGRGRGKRGTRGRGRGRGRGRNASPPAPDWWSADPDVPCTSTPKVRGRGRGRGRDKAQGEARLVEAPTEDVNAVQNETPLPRGFSKCSGCGDFFGDAFLPAHQLRCAALKSKNGSTTVSGGEKTPFGISNSPAQKRSSTASREVRPTSFVKCDGCHEHFGETLLSIHQQKCTGWKNLNRISNSSATCSSPWLSSKTTTTNNMIGQFESSSANRNSGYRLGSDSSQEGEGSNGGVRSPPWLLAAERRLQQQTSAPSQNSFTNYSGSNRVLSPDRATSSDRVTSPGRCVSPENLPSPINDNNAVSSHRNFSIDSQQWMLEKYQRQRDNEDSLGSQSQSLLSDSRNCSRKPSSSSKNVKKKKSKSNESGPTRRQSVPKSRFSAIELSDSDDDTVYSINNDRVVSNSSASNLTGVTPSSALTHGSGVGLNMGEIQVECPLCGDLYPSYIIEMHAATCYA